MRRLTIKDVARHANVSIATVSRVLNNHHWISGEVRKKVLHSINELGYKPNALARGLVSHKSNTIGVLIPDMSNYFFAEVLRGIEDAIHERKSNVFICNTDNNEQRMLRYLDFLQEKQVEGFIFTSEAVSKSYYERFLKVGAPFALLSTESSEFPMPAVKVDEFQASKDAVTYLIEKGHKRIGMIHFPLSNPNAGLPRFLGYKTAMEEYGLLTDSSWIAEGFGFESGRAAMKQLLSIHPDITAVFAASDEMAIGAMVEAQKRGLILPEDLSVMGFDNVKLSSMHYPALTTVAQPLFEMGRQTVDLLFKLIQTDEKGRAELNKTINLPHYIVERESVVDLPDTVNLVDQVTRA